MYSENAAALLALAQTVPTVATSVGMATGGRATDPAMTNVPLPCVWLVMSDDKPHDPSTGSNPAGQVVITTYVLMVHVPYVSQADLLGTQLPLLESIVAAIRGQQAPKGQKWRYEGQQLSVINVDRLIYEQKYSIVGFI